MSKMKPLAMSGIMLLTSMIFAQVAFADVAPPPDCKPGEDPETTYCNPVKIPRNGQIIVPESPADPEINKDTPVETSENTSTDITTKEELSTDTKVETDVKEEEVKPENSEVKEETKEEETSKTEEPIEKEGPFGINPIILYSAIGGAVVIAGTGIGIFIKVKNKPPIQ